MVMQRWTCFSNSGGEVAISLCVREKSAMVKIKDLEELKRKMVFQESKWIKKKNLKEIQKGESEGKRGIGIVGWWFSMKKGHCFVKDESPYGYSWYLSALT